MPSIRSAHNADRSALRALHKRLYIEHQSALMPKALELLSAFRNFEDVLRDDMDAMIDDVRTLVIVAEAESNIVGYITGKVVVDESRVLARKGRIDDWFVLPEARGTGVGRRLLQGITDRFKDDRCSVLEIATWPFNTRTRQVFEESGFVEAFVTYRKEI